MAPHPLAGAAGSTLIVPQSNSRTRALCFISALSDDLLLGILSLCSFEDLIRAEMACKRFKKLLSQSQVRLQRSSFLNLLPTSLLSVCLYLDTLCTDLHAPAVAIRSLLMLAQYLGRFLSPTQASIGCKPWGDLAFRGELSAFPRRIARLCSRLKDRTQLMSQVAWVERLLPMCRYAHVRQPFAANSLDLSYAAEKLSVCWAALVSREPNIIFAGGLHRERPA